MKRIKKNAFVEGTIFASITIILVKVLGALYNIPFYNIIGEEGGSLYNYAYMIYSLFLNISTAGIPIAISKIISEYNALELYEAKERTYVLGKKIMLIISLVSFFIVFVFSKEIAFIYKGNLAGGASLDDISLVIKAVSFCLLIIPFLSLSRGYLQGHKFIAVSSNSQLIEQVVRIAFVLLASYLVINVLGQKVSFGVATSLLGASIAGIVTYGYLMKKIKDNKNEFPVSKTKDEVSNKEIIKKILTYSIPFVIMVVTIDIYNIVDTTLILRGLTHLGYSTADAEVIASIISTWGSKILIIVNSVATGITMSLMPHMVSSNAKNDMKETNHLINQSLSIILCASLFLSIIISTLSSPIYTIFYSSSKYGSSILQVLIFLSIFTSIDIVVKTILHGLNKFKIIYISTITGFVINAILDIPLMMLFSKLSLPVHIASICATMIGYSVSLLISYIMLKKQNNIDLKPLMQNIKKLILPLFVIIILVNLLNHYIIIDSLGRISLTLVVGIYFIVLGAIYLFILYKNKGLESIFGKSIMNKIFRRK